MLKKSVKNPLNPWMKQPTKIMSDHTSDDNCRIFNRLRVPNGNNWMVVQIGGSFCVWFPFWPSKVV